MEPPGPAGACHRAGQRPDPVGRPDNKLRVIREQRLGVEKPAPEITLRSIRATRLCGWCLVLEPGQTADAVAQSAPGLRVVLDGGVIAELVPGQPDRGMTMRQGEFYWQDAGTTRAIRNIGTTRLELVEFELK